MKIFAKQKSNNINLKDTCVDWWFKHLTICYIIFFLIVMGIASYVWYGSLYAYSWDAQRKSEYTSTQNRVVELKEKQFNNTIEKYSARLNKYNAQLEQGRDLFKSK